MTTTPLQKPDVFDRIRFAGESLRRLALPVARFMIKAEFQGDADDFGHDPRYAAPVSRFGQAKPARKRDTVQRRVRLDGEEIAVNEIRDGLYRMHQRREIDDDAYNAARTFQLEFMRCQYGRPSTPNLNGTSGGCVSIEDIYTRSLSSRDYVHNTLRLLGGPDTSLAKAVVFFVGFDHDFIAIANQFGKSRNFWSPVLISALEVMGGDYARMMRGKPRKPRMTAIPAQGLTIPR